MATATKSPSNKTKTGDKKTKTSVNETPDLNEIEANAREALRTVHQIRAQEDAQMGNVAEAAAEVTETLKEGFQEIEIEGEEEVRTFGQNLMSGAKRAGKGFLFLAGGPVPKTKKQLVVAGSWYLIGAVTPMGDPARTVVQSVRGV